MSLALKRFFVAVACAVLGFLLGVMISLSQAVSALGVFSHLPPLALVIIYGYGIAFAAILAYAMHLLAANWAGKST